MFIRQRVTRAKCIKVCFFFKCDKNSTRIVLELRKITRVLPNTKTDLLMASRYAFWSNLVFNWSLNLVLETVNGVLNANHSK